MKETGIETLKKEGISEANIEFHPVLDLRYVGQYHEVQLQVLWNDIVSFNLAKIRKEFHKEHNRLFGYSLGEDLSAEASAQAGGTEIELINIRLRVLGKAEKPKFLTESKSTVSVESALKEKRQVYIPETNQVKQVAVYDGDISLCGNTIVGPAIIEKVNTSIFVSESYSCFIDKYGSFIVYNKEAFPDGYKDLRS